VLLEIINVFYDKHFPSKINLICKNKHWYIEHLLAKVKVEVSQYNH